MSFTNEPIPEETPNTKPDAKSPTAPNNRLRNSIIGGIAILVIAVGAYSIFDNAAEEVNTKADSSDETPNFIAQKSMVQAGFDESLARLDSMATVNNYLNEELKAKNEEIAKIKSEIRSILNKKDADAADLSKVQALVTELNQKVSDMRNEIARLQQENKLLSEELMASNAIRDSLAGQIEVASTLNASNIKITPVNVKRNGKEKVSTSAKKVDKLVVSFDVRNRIIQSGSTDLYVIVIGPDGIPVKSGASATGRFNTRDEGEKTYTAKVPIELETAVNKNIAFSFVPGEDFKKGVYSVKIYQNGFLIGEGFQTLRKGGIFG